MGAIVNQRAIIDLVKMQRHVQVGAVALKGEEEGGGRGEVREVKEEGGGRGEVSSSARLCASSTAAYKNVLASGA